MRGWPGSGDLWGKFADEARGGPAWHPLVDHCTDVACALEALLGQPTIRRRLARTGGLDDLEDVQVARLCFLGFLHDLGKCNWGFQRKIQPGVPPAEHGGHVAEVAALLLAPELQPKFLRILPLEAMATWGDEAAIDELFCAAVSHHRRQLVLDQGGALPGLDKRSIRFWQPRHGHEPLRRLEELVAAARATFAAAFRAGGGPLPGGAPFQHAFCGLLMLADWLGSSETFFPFRATPDEDRPALAREAAARAVTAVGLAVEGRRAGLRARPVQDATFNGFPLNPAQAAVAALPRDPPPPLVVLEAETGSGKTEAALLHFKRLFEAGQVDGLYFALPTRSSASQIQERIRRALQRLFPEDDRPPVILAVPGYIRADDRSGSRLPGFEVVWDDDPGEAGRQRRWAAEHPKRYMAGQIVVGTVDQALLGNLQVPYAHLRSSALLRHLLVVDEVHSSDAYMTAVLGSLLRAHAAAGGHALLMSATLGGAARAAYLDEPVPPLAAAEMVPYPLLSFSGGVRPIPIAGPDKAVRLEPLAAIDQPAALASRLIEAATAGAKVLVVRNTVGDAVALFETVRNSLEAQGRAGLLLEVAGVPTLHHGRFAGEDRKLLDEAVEKRLGRERPEGGAIVIGTQTLEQSLDIDADLLVTDLCPIDVLLQRIGRLHRHRDRTRPAGFAEARAVILTPSARGLAPFLTSRAHGLGSVYPDLRVVEATWRLIEAHPVLEIPAMNRMLVERATHPEVLRAVEAEGGDAWREHGQAVLGKEFSQRGIAALHVICRGKPFGKFAFPDAEEKIVTRLSANDRVLALPEAARGPFGAMVSSLKLPAHLLRGVAGDAAVTKLTDTGRGFTFAYGGEAFRYDERGLAREGTAKA
ncbi:CRISPR-associated helicase Cas3' [Benzoatithermus flavus]|uniref:CRISPR-associated helicase Cas3 n=1 Tax=Benzoatithermus flavus TaxID=3108223 RepID=A0ABU8XMK3_9PROT